MTKIGKWLPTIVPVLMSGLDEVADLVSPWIASHPKLALTLASIALVLNHLMPTPSVTIEQALAVKPAGEPAAPVVQ